MDEDDNRMGQGQIRDALTLSCLLNRVAYNFRGKKIIYIHIYIYIYTHTYEGPSRKRFTR